MGRRFCMRAPVGRVAPRNQRGRMSSTRARTTEQRAGFTLVEVMITVAIVSILAVIAIPSFNSYIKKSRTVEATGFLAEVKARQESYRFDFGMYCNVSGAPNTLYPSGTPTPLPLQPSHPS